MSTFWNVLLIILFVLVVLLVILYFVGRKLQKKQAIQQEQMEAAKQTVTMLIIDKKKMKIKDSGLPAMVIEQTPKLMRLEPSSPSSKPSRSKSHDSCLRCADL